MRLMYQRFLQRSDEEFHKFVLLAFVLDIEHKSCVPETLYSEDLGSSAKV